MLDTTEQTRERYARNARSYFDRHYAADTVYGNLEAWLTEASLRK
jgi:hypothetical protein